MDSNKQIKIGAIISYGVVVFNILAGLLYTPWMVAKIGRDDFGLYVLVTTFLAYFVVDYGMWQSINKLISQYRAEGKSDKIQKTIGIASKIYLILDIFICIVLFFVYFFIDSIFDNLSSDQLVKFKTIFIIAAVFSVLNFPFGFVRGIMFAYEYLIQNRFFELGTKIVVILCTVTVLFCGGGLYWLVLVYAFVPLLKNILIVFFLYHQGIRMNWRSWSKKIARSIIGISVWLFLYVIAELFINNLSPTLITIRSSLEQVAVFAIGVTIYGYIYQISNSVAGLFLPKISRMKYLGQTKEIGIYALKVGRIQLIISGYIIFGVFVTGSIFIKAWMGEAFADSYYVASLLIIPGLIIYAQQVELAYLYALDKIYYQAILMLLSAITAVTLSWILIPTLGAIGAAIAICIANFLFMVIGMNIVYNVILKFDTSTFFKTALKFIFIFIVVGVLVNFLIFSVIENHLFIGNNWVKFIVIALIYSFIYSISSYCILLNDDEKGLIKELLYKINNACKCLRIKHF